MGRQYMHAALAIEFSVDNAKSSPSTLAYSGSALLVVMLSNGADKLLVIPSQIFVVSKEKIQQEGYATLYSYMTRNKNGAVAKLVFSVPKPFQVQIAVAQVAVCGRHHSNLALACELILAWHLAVDTISGFTLHPVSSMCD